MLVETEDLCLMAIQEHLQMLKKYFWFERRNSSLMKKEIRYLILMMLKIQTVKMKNHQLLERKRKRRTMIITKLIKLLSLDALLDQMVKMISLSKESKRNYLKTKLLELTGQLTSTWIEDLKPIVKPTNLMSKIPISLSSLQNIRLQLLTFIAVKLQRK